MADINIEKAKSEAAWWTRELEIKQGELEKNKSTQARLARELDDAKRAEGELTRYMAGGKTKLDGYKRDMERYADDLRKQAGQKR
jgi:hypothetical protein